MATIYDIHPPVRIGDRWHFSNGRTLPVVSGGSDTDTPPAQVTTPDGVTLSLPGGPLTDPSAPAPAQQSGNSRLFTEDEVAKIRREEKDKLYNELSEVRTTNKELLSKLSAWEQEKQEREAEEARLAAEAAEARRKAEEAEMDAKALIQSKEQEWDAKLRAEREEREKQFQLLEMEKQFQQLQVYIERRRREEADNIAPQLLPLVNGSSEQEVEAQIAALREATEGIVAEIASRQVPQAPAGFGIPAAPAAGTPGLVTAPAPISDIHSDTQTLSLQDLQKMDMKTFIENRDRLLSAANPRNAPRPF